MFYIAERKDQPYINLTHKSYPSIEAAKAAIDKMVSYGVWSYSGRWLMVDGLWTCNLKAFPHMVIEQWIKPVF